MRSLILFLFVALLFIRNSDGRHYVDVAPSMGLNHIHQTATAQQELYNDFYNQDYRAGFDLTLGGVAVGDYDNDGDEDIVFTRFREMPVLYRHDGTHYTDVSLEQLAPVFPANASLADSLTMSGAAWIDVDNDGMLDLLMLGVYTDVKSRCLLFRNLGVSPQTGAVQFEEVSEQRGFVCPQHLELLPKQTYGPASISTVDWDLDGFLDLAVFFWTSEFVSSPGAYEDNASIRFYHNEGGRDSSRAGYFVDVTSQLEALVPISSLQAYAFAGAFGDLDGDGWPDLIVAGDFSTDRFFLNLGDPAINTSIAFSDATASMSPNVGVSAGFAAEMGLAGADLDHDGRTDFVVSDINQMLFWNQGHAMTNTYVDPAVTFGWLWGVTSTDIDNSGMLSVAVTGGYVPTGLRPVLTRPLLENIGSPTAPFFTYDLSNHGMFTEDTRTVTSFDFDGDGDLDLLTVRSGPHAPRLYENRPSASTVTEPNAWTRVMLRGVRSNRRGIGARVYMCAAGTLTLWEMGVTGDHFMARSALWPHFGLGASRTSILTSNTQHLYSVVVYWPASRTVNVVRGVEPNAAVNIVEFDPSTVVSNVSLSHGDALVATGCQPTRRVKPVVWGVVQGIGGDCHRFDAHLTFRNVFFGSSSNGVHSFDPSKVVIPQPHTSFVTVSPTATFRAPHTIVISFFVNPSIPSDVSDEDLLVGLGEGLVHDVANNLPSEAPTVRLHIVMNDLSSCPANVQLPPLPEQDNAMTPMPMSLGLTPDDLRTYPFYPSQVLSAANAGTPSSSPSSSSSSTVVVAVIAVIAIALVAILLIVVYRRRRQQPHCSDILVSTNSQAVSLDSHLRTGDNEENSSDAGTDKEEQTLTAHELAVVVVADGFGDDIQSIDTDTNADGDGDGVTTTAAADSHDETGGTTTSWHEDNAEEMTKETPMTLELRIDDDHNDDNDAAINETAL